MKKTIFIISILFSITLFWCSNKNNFEFSFDNFYWYFFTENKFTFTDIQADWLWYNIIKNDILKMYKKINSSWYVDNIIIIKKQSDKELSEFVEDTIKKTKIQWYKLDTTRDIKIKCIDEVLKWKSTNWRVNGNLNTTYFNHSFFKHNNNIYIVSYSSQDESERNTFASDVKNIKCKK